MRTKWPLFTGILLLTIGILLRKLTEIQVFGLVILISGVMLKIYYIVKKIHSGEYKPGYELGILLFGLTIFMAGLYMRSHESSVNPTFLMVPGIMLKVVFIVIFIRKTRMQKIPESNI